MNGWLWQDYLCTGASFFVAKMLTPRLSGPEGDPEDPGADEACREQESFG